VLITVDSLTERDRLPARGTPRDARRGWPRGALFFEVRFQQSLLARSSSIFFGFWSRDALLGGEGASLPLRQLGVALERGAAHPEEAASGSSLLVVPRLRA
jgi:hypothetical protein